MIEIEKEANNYYVMLSVVWLAMSPSRIMVKTLYDIPHLIIQSFSMAIIIILIINIHLYTATYRKTRTVAVYKLKWSIK